MKVEIKLKKKKEVVSFEMIASVISRLIFNGANFEMFFFQLLSFDLARTQALNTLGRRGDPS